MSERQSKVSRKRKMLSMENIEETKNKKCCKKNCLKDTITLQDVFEARSEFWELNRGFSCAVSGVCPVSVPAAFGRHFRPPRARKTSGTQGKSG